MNKLSPEDGRGESLRHGWRSAKARDRALAVGLLATVAVTSFAPSSSAAATPASTAGSAVSAPLQSLPSLEVPPYMGTWYQVAWFPNRFQKQCVSDTRAEYRQRDDGRIEVINRCRLANGQFDDADGIARPAGSTSGASTRGSRRRLRGSSTRRASRSS